MQKSRKKQVRLNLKVLTIQLNPTHKNLKENFKKVDKLLEKYSESD